MIDNRTDHCLNLEKMLSEHEPKREAKKQNMTFFPLCKSLAPSVVIGTLAAAGCQEVASNCSSNPECITLAGMAAQYIGSWTPFIYLHYQNNKHRLQREDGSIDYRTFGQDLGAVLASDSVGNKIWALSYAVANELSLRAGINPAAAGFISGVSSGTLYTLFTAYAAPKINSVMNCLKDKISLFKSKIT